MYKYILLTIVMTLVFQFQSGAQEILNSTNRQHIIHLKNGSSIIGVLIDFTQGKPAVIEVADGQRISVPHETIQSLEPITQKTAKSIIRKSKDAPYLFKEIGWHYGSSLGFISPSTSRDDGRISVSLNMDATYHFSRLLGVGLSVGYESYQEGGFHDYIPIQVILTGYLSPKKTSLFYSLGAGYGIAIADQEDMNWATLSNEGGITLYPKIGIRLSGHDGVNTTLFSGIKIQKSTLETRWGEELEESIIQERTFKRLIIGLGIVF